VRPYLRKKTKQKLTKKSTFIFGKQLLAQEKKKFFDSKTKTKTHSDFKKFP
jgi:hypothetical protein